MNTHNRNALRAAVLIWSLLAQTSPKGPKTDNTDSAWQECRRPRSPGIPSLHYSFSTAARIHSGSSSPDSSR